MKALVALSVFSVSLLAANALAASAHCTISGGGLDNAQFKIAPRGQIYAEEFQVKDWGFFYAIGKNKNSLSVRKNKKPLFQTTGIADLHISVILDPSAPEDKLSALTVDCAE